MSSPLHAAYCPDHAVLASVEVVENVPVARDTFRLRVTCAEMARRITPGQFVMLRLAGCNDPLLARPLALYDTFYETTDLTSDPPAMGSPAGLDVVYLRLGKMTRRLAEYRPGQLLEIWGPLGNGFELTAKANDIRLSHLMMVAGGIGQTPFLALAQEALGQKTYGSEPGRLPTVSRVSLCYGARSADYLAGIEDFEAAGVDVRLATDDGSRGHHGLVTDLVLDSLQGANPPDRIVCCGPEPMMAAVAGLAREHAVPCFVSLETPMACGIGICFTCVARVRDAHGGWDYKRTCVEGPVFDASVIEW